MNIPPWATPAPWQGYQQAEPQPNPFIPPYHHPYDHLYPHPQRVYVEPPRLTSSKYPSLNPILASDTTLLRFDVRRKPRKEILASTFYSNCHLPATSNGVTYLRLISKSFPWTIDIKADAGNVVLCETVWDALYVALQNPIEDSEWGLIVLGMKKQKDIVEKAAKKRMEAEPPANHDDRRMKRIDYLGEATLFKGLEKDEEYIKKRQMPGDKGCSETWVVKFA